MEILLSIGLSLLVNRIEEKWKGILDSNIQRELNYRLENTLRSLSKEYKEFEYYGFIDNVMKLEVNFENPNSIKKCFKSIYGEKYKDLYESFKYKFNEEIANNQILTNFLMLLKFEELIVEKPEDNTFLLLYLKQIKNDFFELNISQSFEKIAELKRRKVKGKNLVNILLLEADLKFWLGNKKECIECIDHIKGNYKKYSDCSELEELEISLLAFEGGNKFEEKSKKMIIEQGVDLNKINNLQIINSKQNRALNEKYDLNRELVDYDDFMAYLLYTYSNNLLIGELKKGYIEKLKKRKKFFNDLEKLILYAHLINCYIFDLNYIDKEMIEEIYKFMKKQINNYHLFETKLRYLLVNVFLNLSRFTDREYKENLKRFEVEDLSSGNFFFYILDKKDRNLEDEVIKFHRRTGEVEILNMLIFYLYRENKIEKLIEVIEELDLENLNLSRNSEYILHKVEITEEIKDKLIQELNESILSKNMDRIDVVADRIKKEKDIFLAEEILSSLIGNILEKKLIEVWKKLKGLNLTITESFLDLLIEYKYLHYFVLEEVYNELTMKEKEYYCYKLYLLFKEFRKVDKIIKCLLILKNKTNNINEKKEINIELVHLALEMNKYTSDSKQAYLELEKMKWFEISRENKFLKISYQFLEGVKDKTFYELNQELLGNDEEFNEVELNCLRYIFSNIMLGENLKKNNFYDIAILKDEHVYISSKYKISKNRNKYRKEKEAKLLKKEGNSCSLASILLVEIMEKNGLLKRGRMEENEKPEKMIIKMRELAKSVSSEKNMIQEEINEFSGLVNDWTYYIELFPSLLIDKNRNWFKVKCTLNKSSRYIITISSLCLLVSINRLNILKEQENIFIQKSVVNLIRQKFHEKLEKEEDLLFNLDGDKPFTRIELSKIKEGLSSLLEIVEDYEEKDKVLDDTTTPSIIKDERVKDEKDPNWNYFIYAYFENYKIITEDAVFQKIDPLKERITNTFEVLKRADLKDFYDVIKEFKYYNYPNIYIGNRDYIVNLIAEPYFQMNFKNMEEYRNYFEEYHKEAIMSIRPVDYLSSGGNIELSLKLNRFNRNLIF